LRSRRQYHDEHGRLERSDQPVQRPHLPFSSERSRRTLGALMVKQSLILDSPAGCHPWARPGRAFGATGATHAPRQSKRPPPSVGRPPLPDMPASLVRAVDLERGVGLARSGRDRPRAGVVGD
jgi:hypothetical protein